MDGGRGSRLFNRLSVEQEGFVQVFQVSPILCMADAACSPVCQLLARDSSLIFGPPEQTSAAGSVPLPSPPSHSCRDAPGEWSPSHVAPITASAALPNRKATTTAIKLDLLTLYLSRHSSGGTSSVDKAGGGFHTAEPSLRIHQATWRTCGSGRCLHAAPQGRASGSCPEGPAPQGRPGPSERSRALPQGALLWAKLGSWG